jgi:hypothetical protein
LTGSETLLVLLGKQVALGPFLFVTFFELLLDKAREKNRSSDQFFSPICKGEGNGKTPIQHFVLGNLDFGAIVCVSRVYVYI